jgi:hypothetical protein
MNSQNITYLTSFLDPECLIRVGGRLQRSMLSEDTKHPYLLQGVRRYFTSYHGVSSVFFARRIEACHRNVMAGVLDIIGVKDYSQCHF